MIPAKEKRKKERGGEREVFLDLASLVAEVTCNFHYSYLVNPGSGEGYERKQRIDFEMPFPRSLSTTVVRPERRN
jgi:hypothetical protein